MDLTPCFNDVCKAKMRLRGSSLLFVSKIVNKQLKMLPDFSILKYNRLSNIFWLSLNWVKKKKTTQLSNMFRFSPTGIFF